MGGESRVYLPREVAEVLGVPPSTLRTYAANFGSLLSDRARPDDADAKGHRHRRYDDADLQVLREAKELLDAGMSYRSVLARLGGDGIARLSPRRRRPARAHPPAAPIAPAPVMPHQAPLTSAEPPPRLTVEGIDELRAAIQSLRVELDAPKPPPPASPAIDPALIVGIVAQLNQIQSRLERIESQLAALATPSPRPSWLARLLGHG